MFHSIDVYRRPRLTQCSAAVSVSLPVINLYILGSLLWLSVMVSIMLLTSLTHLLKINGKTPSEQTKANLISEKHIHPKL